MPDLLKILMEFKNRSAGTTSRISIQIIIFKVLRAFARQLQREKVEGVLATGAAIVASGNPGCILQLRAGLRGTGIEVLHTVELLDRAYESASA